MRGPLPECCLRSIVRYSKLRVIMRHYGLDIDRDRSAARSEKTLEKDHVSCARSEGCFPWSMFKDYKLEAAADSQMTTWQ